MNKRPSNTTNQFSYSDTKCFALQTHIINGNLFFQPHRASSSQCLLLLAQVLVFERFCCCFYHSLLVTGVWLFRYPVIWVGPISRASSPSLHTTAPCLNYCALNIPLFSSYIIYNSQSTHLLSFSQGFYLDFWPLKEL